MNPGERIGPYRLLSLLGRGGMGEVFSAIHERMGQLVALKLLIRVEPACAARLVQEARALSQLDHPGVVRVLFLGETDDGIPYLVLEQLAGCSLREHLRDHPSGLPQTRAGSLIAQVAAAMSAVHRCGIVHRDLKPDNILLTGDPEVVKIIDFGIASVPPPESFGVDTLVETSDEGPRWLGTAAYMAPEQCRRSTQIGPPADVYTLGVVLYETLCGQPPFRATDPVELAALHLQATPNLSLLPPGPLRHLTHAMLAKDPAGRPSMAEVAAVLAGLAGVDRGRRTIARAILAAAGALLMVRTGPWAWGELRHFFPGGVRKNAWPAIDRPEKGISYLQMRPSGLIMIAHMEQGSVLPAEMLAALPSAYLPLPHACVSVPATGVAASGDFRAAGAVITAWFRDFMEPLLARHQDYRLVYFGVAPIPLIVLLGWLVGPLHPAEVRLRHHGEKRFIPWDDVPVAAQLLPPCWSRERDDRAGEVVVRLSTSHPINKIAARAVIQESLCEVDLQLSIPGEDVFRAEAEVAAVVVAWKRVLAEITERFPRVQRVHLFASVQAGVAFLLGTCVSRTMHPAITTYHYHAGVFQPALTVNNPADRLMARD